MRNKEKNKRYYILCWYLWFCHEKLNNSTFTDEEKEGIETISAGVAAYTRGV